MQYKNVTPNINNIYFKAIGTNPIIAPNLVNGTNIPITINNIDDKKLVDKIKEIHSDFVDYLD